MVARPALACLKFGGLVNNRPTASRAPEFLTVQRVKGNYRQAPGQIFLFDGCPRDPKTRLVDFRPPSASSGRSSSFDLLGFTHYWGRSRKGRWVIKRKTAKSRFARAVQSINQWCRSHRHDPIDEQHAGLTRRLRGHYAYYGITGNGRALARLQRQTERCWRKWLNRRSNRSGMNWDRFCLVLALYPLPPPRVVHSVYRRAAMR